jgi:hemerythrin-like domain-containing protein
MKPIVPLKVEHGLIDQMVRAIRDKAVKITMGEELDLVFIDTAVDFLRTYADRTHHGKEEDILFREMREKDLSAEDREAMEELVQEHVFARETVSELVEAKEMYLEGDEDALDTVLLKIGVLLDLYPKHIKKEDDGLFPAAMAYFDADEQEAMVEEMRAFDRQMIHETYRAVVEDMKG